MAHMMRVGAEFARARDKYHAARRAYIVALANLNDHGMSFAEIGRGIGVSRSRAQQLVEEGRRERAISRTG
jgi:DNA-binding transcriptional regulator LsrR (DeoR family)